MTTTTAATPTTTTGKELTKPQRQRMTLRRLFDSQKPEVAKLLPKGMNAERLFRIALSECVKNPELLECSAESWALALQTCAAQGLYPDSGLGYMYLIPRSKQVTAQRGYQGDMKLARNTGEVSIAPPEVVYEKDHYKVTKGLDPNIEHVPYDGDDDPGPLRAVYAVAKLKSGEVVFVTLNKRDVMRHKASSSSASSSSSPWNKHEAAMWKKTAIHELFKWIPKDSEAVERVAALIAGGMEPRTIDTTAVDLGKIEVPVAGEAESALDRVANELEGDLGGDAAAPAAAGPACGHPKVKPSDVAGGKSAVCPDCNATVTDPDAAEPTLVEAIRAVAAVAGDTAKAPPKGQRRLE